MADGLLNKASIILTPTGYKAGTLYNVAPVVEPYEDFDFARASVASRVNSSGLVEMVGRTLGSELVQNGDFSELGSELVTNGDFATDSDWSFIGTTEISGGIASFPNSTNSFLIQSNVADLSVKNYKLTYEVVSTNGNNFRLAGGSSAFGLITLDSATIGTKTAYLTSNGTQGALQFNNHNFVGSIDNVSVKQVDPNDYWTLGTGWSIEDGNASCDGTDGVNLSQNGVIQNSKTYKITFDVDLTSGTLFLRVGLSYITDLTITTSGSYEATVVSDGTNLIFRSGVFVGSIDNVSVKEIIDTNNIPRISYDSNGENGHILLEPTSTNLVTYSEDFEQWTEEANIDVTNNSITSPDGTQNAAKLQLTGSSGGTDGKISFSVSPSATTHTFSVFAKKGNHDYIYIWMNISGGTNIARWIDLDDGSVNVGSGTATVTTTSFSNDWWKIEYTFDATNLSSIKLEVADDGTSTGTGGDNIYVWGAQLEELSYATSYIPTLTGSTETRATETANGAGSADLINSTEGVLYAEIAALADDGTNRCIALSDGSVDDRISLIFAAASDIIRVLIKSDGSTSFDEEYEVTTTLDYHKVAMKYKANDFAMWIDGVERFTDTSGSAPIGLNQLTFDVGNGILPFYGKVKALAVFNEALSDDELNNLTG